MLTLRLAVCLCAVGVSIAASAEQVIVRFEAATDTVWVQDEEGNYGPIAHNSHLEAEYEFDTSQATELHPISAGTSTMVVMPVRLNVDLFDLPSSLPGYVPLAYASATLGYSDTRGDPFFDGLAPDSERVLTQITTAFEESIQQVVGGTWSLMVRHTSPDPMPSDFRVLRMPEGHDTFVVLVSWRDPNRVNLAQPSFSAEYRVTSLVLIPEAISLQLIGLATVLLASWRRRVTR